MLQLGRHLLGVLVYPGGLCLLMMGLIAEVAAARLLTGGGGIRAAARGTLRGILPARGWWVPAGLPGGAALLALLAATSLAVPWSPVAPEQRSVMVSAVALIAVSAALIGWGRARGEPDGSLLMMIQAAWLVALLAPALITPNLRPQDLGIVLLPKLVPVKIATGLLYLLCLPGLLQLLPETAPQGLPGAAGRGQPSAGEAGFGLVRVLLWLPYCGLFSSLFFAPPTDDVAGALRFLLTTLGAMAITVGLAANLIHGGPTVTRRFYLWGVTPLALVTVVLAVIVARI